ncbi:flavodoxin domain-containing protein [Kineosporia sp. NBRC 101731]|uniref:flavodoxin family protein n=1 Tax=Kineosporia sp. NBRC 101731 TaxID=3032199 RepID=UPI0024A53CEF|nr:flavodoxin domain-containing protein [Kineosporia sp. NBRC 101731]GLY29581.1 hypothetical protein Kisp02_29460 [Kineosporia sp. NBRC 101731]
MKALLVYESMFGNTESVARAVAAGLGTVMHTDIHTVASAPLVLPDDVDLLVVGAPHGLDSCRDLALTQAHRAGIAARSTGIGVCEWLQRLQPADIAAVAFGTCVYTQMSDGTDPVSHRLHHLGMRVMRHESFYTRDTLGPLEGHELEHARLWAQRLATEVAGTLASA